MLQVLPVVEHLDVFKAGGLHVGMGGVPARVKVVVASVMQPMAEYRCPPIWL